MAFNVDRLFRDCIPNATSLRCRTWGGALRDALALASRPAGLRRSVARACLAWLFMGCAQAAPWQPPPPMVISYDVEAAAKGFQLQGDGELRWQQRAGDYDASLMISALFVFKRTQSSTGHASPAGLVPLKFQDHKRKVETWSFSPQQNTVTLPDGAQLPWPADGQDRVSMLIDIGRRTVAAQDQGEKRVRIPVISGSRLHDWEFEIQGKETLVTGEGPLETWRLERVDPQRGSQQATLWLAPRLYWMPAKLIIQESNGDAATQVLRAHRLLP